MFITQSIPSCPTLMIAKKLFHTFSILKKNSTFTQYMSVSHGHSTMGGIEYDGGFLEKTKKEKVSH